MTVYVDDVRHRFGNMVMCHLWADTLDELLAMVDRIGVQRKWIQGHPTLSSGKHRNGTLRHRPVEEGARHRSRCGTDGSVRASRTHVAARSGIAIP